MNGKLSLIDTTVINIASTATFKRAYAKTNLTYILVKGKQTKILKPTIRLCNYELGNKTLKRITSSCKYK
jgi:NAD(P)H-hydrate repair Nnr-like enzyme with NAD(P)H-hydrate dehydratase domain